MDGALFEQSEKFLKKYANIDSKLSQCEDWFGGTTTYTVVSEFDDPTWPCIECLPKVVSDFVGEQSRVHIMPISAKWKHKSSIHIGFIVFNGGVTTFFAKSVCQNATVRLCGAWIRIYYVKMYSPLRGLFWAPAGLRRAARGARICETHLLILYLNCHRQLNATIPSWFAKF